MTPGGPGYGGGVGSAGAAPAGSEANGTMSGAGGSVLAGGPGEELGTAESAGAHAHARVYVYV